MLLGLRLGSLGLALLQHLVCGLRHHARQRQLDLWRQLLVFGRQRHPQLLLDLLTIEVANMLCNMRHHGPLHLWSFGVLSHKLLHQRIVNHRHVHLDMRIVILVHKRLHWLHAQHRHVLGHWVFWLLVVWQRDQLVWILNAKNLQHPAVQLWQVVNVRSHLRHLNDRLVLHDTLRHRGSIWVAHRNNVYVLVVLVASGTCAVFWIKVVIWVCVVTNDDRQQAQLLFECVVQTGLYSRHNF